MAETKKPTANKTDQSSATKFSQEALGKDAVRIMDKIKNVVKQTSVDDLLGTSILINEKNEASTKESEEKNITGLNVISSDIIIDDRKCATQVHGFLENMRSAVSNKTEKQAEAHQQTEVNTSNTEK
jgi:hypothetical protein